MKLKAWFLSLVILIVGIELVSFLYLSWNARAVHSPSHHFKILNGSLGWNECTWADSVSHHPYLSLRYHHQPPCHHHFANLRGMLGEELPFVKDKKFYNVLLLGGSVAELMHQSNQLETQLNATATPPFGEKFKVWTAAITAGQQPRQAIAHLLYGDIADLVVSVEGYNERFNFSTYNSPEVASVTWSQLESLLLNVRASDGWLKLLAMRLRKSSYHAGQNPVLGRSYSAVLFYSLAMRSIAESVDLPPPIVPKLNDKAVAIDIYASYFASMGAIARQRKQALYVFLQPIPGISKPLTEHDRAIVGDLAYTENVKFLYDEITKHPLHKINVIPILDTFKDFKDDLYVDHIHFLPNSAGNEWLARRIVSELAQREKWKKK